MTSRFLVLAAVVAAAAACYTGSAVDNNNVPGQPVVDANPTDPANVNAPGNDDTATAKLSGLPCDVALLLKTSCDECHGKKLANGAPTTIVSYDDLAAKWDEDPTKTIAELALSRMKSTKKPMPPDGKLGTDEIAILENWIKAGMPRGSCGTSDSSNQDSDAGHSIVDPDAGTPPPTSVCTSGQHVDPLLTGELMHPGNACITCHTQQMGPSLTVAGTLYPTAHEPDDCNGADGKATDTKVLIIDATGTMRSLPVNASGNFTSDTALPTPYRAMVVRGNSIREMKATQTDGDCNSCHTEWGDNGAPGRVMAP